MLFTLLAGWNILISPLIPPLAKMFVFSSPSFNVVLRLFVIQVKYVRDDATASTYQAKV